MPAFRYEANTDPRLTGTIADLMLRGPAARAAAAERVAAIQAQGAKEQAGAWSGAVQNIGQLVGAIPAQLQQAKRADLQDKLGALQLNGAQQSASDDQRLRAAYQQSGGDPAAMRAILANSGGLTLQHDQTLQQMEQQQADRHKALTSQIGLTLHDRLRPDDPTSNLAAMQEALNTAEQQKLITSEQAQQFGAMASADPTKIPEVAKSWAGLTAAGRAEIEKTITNKPGERTTSRWDNTPVGDALPEKKPDYTINGQRFSGDGTPIGDVQPPQPQPKSLEAKEGFVIKGTTNVPSYNPADGSWSFAGKPVSADQVARAAPPKDPMAQALQSVALQTAQLNLSDKQRRDANISAIAQGMKDGTIPPDPEGLTRQGLYADVVGALTKDGVNFSTLRQQYLAQKRLIQTENSPQGVRLDVAVRSGLAMYDKVDELSSQWDGKGWGPLSRANLRLATEGALGPGAQKLAVQLNGQIAQLTSDVATIEQNGMTPTQEARKVAEQGLQSWWGDGTIKAMTAQGRANMRIRDSARKETSPLVPGQSAATTLQPNMTHIVEQNGVRYQVTTDAAGKVLSSVPVPR